MLETRRLLKSLRRGLICEDTRYKYTYREWCGITYPAGRIENASEYEYAALHSHEVEAIMISMCVEGKFHALSEST